MIQLFTSITNELVLALKKSIHRNFCKRDEATWYKYRNKFSRCTTRASLTGIVEVKRAGYRMMKLSMTCSRRELLRYWICLPNKM
jgi:hypothetical protein